WWRRSRHSPSSATLRVDADARARQRDGSKRRTRGDENPPGGLLYRCTCPVSILQEPSNRGDAVSPVAASSSRWMIRKVAHTGFITTRSPTSTDVRARRVQGAFIGLISVTVHQCSSRLLSVLLSWRLIKYRIVALPRTFGLFQSMWMAIRSYHIQ